MGFLHPRNYWDLHACARYEKQYTKFFACWSNRLVERIFWRVDRARCSVQKKFVTWMLMRRGLWRSVQWWKWGAEPPAPIWATCNAFTCWRRSIVVGLGRRTFPILCQTASWTGDYLAVKPSAIGQPTWPTQPSIPQVSVN